MDISIVAPAYNEELVLEDFVRRIAQEVLPHYGSLELIIVDDGSDDSTWELINDFRKRFPWVVGVKLIRNYGHQVAVMAGLKHSNGKLVAIIDADLQDPPEIIPRMSELVSGDIQMVYGQRILRDGETILKTISAKLFYRLLNRVTTFEIPVDTGDFRVVRRDVVEEILKLNDTRPFLRGYFAYFGAKSLPYSYHRMQRHAGKTKYTLRKMLRLALSAFLSFSVAPLNLLLYGSIFSVFLGFVGIITMSVSPVDEKVFLAFGLLLVISSFLILMFLISSAVFIIGKYVESIHAHSRGLPLYIEENTTI